MKKYCKIIITVLLIVACIMFTSINLYAHSGRTDSNGGHRDNKNVSGLGYYHYHCGGHPPHLHTDGVCPYSSNKIKQEIKSETSSVGTVNKKKQETKSETSSVGTVNKKKQETKSETSFVDTVIILGALIGGGYYFYKKRNKHD